MSLAQLSLSLFYSLRVWDLCSAVDGGGEADSGADDPDEEQHRRHHQLGDLGGEGTHDCSPPVHGDGQHGEHAGRDRGEGDELVDGAVERSKVPIPFRDYSHWCKSYKLVCHLPVPHVDGGEDTVEGGHEDISQGQVQQEIVGHAPHSAMSCLVLFRNDI